MKKLLIVEDDVDIANILQNALAAKYELKILHDSTDIITTLKSFKPDILLLDNFIGQSNASEVIREIQALKEGNNIPFILFSAHPDIEKIAFNLKAKAFLPKPFKLSELYACLNKVAADEYPTLLHNNPA